MPPLLILQPRVPILHSIFNLWYLKRTVSGFDKPAGISLADNEGDLGVKGKGPVTSSLVSSLVCCSLSAWVGTFELGGGVVDT